MSLTPRLAKKILVILFGILLVLIGAYYQIKPTQNKNNSLKNPGNELAPRLRNSLIQQTRNFQRCWLQSRMNPDDQVWQIYVDVEPNGRVKEFKILNSQKIDSNTLKCLIETGYRLKFPTFLGESFSFTIPIVMKRVNDNR